MCRPVEQPELIAHTGTPISNTRLRQMKITFVQGDITDQDVDAIVNAANHTLLGGGGVDGAIHRRGGPEILAECKKLRQKQYPDGLPTGQAVATIAGRLKARWVIHTVGPTYAKSKDKSQLLADCFRNSLAVADELRAATVAFPAISTGVYRWPVDDAARIALETVRATDSRATEVRFVLFDQRAYDAFTAQASSEG
jgi:O-acetyl-ADP-ribose deacetylase